MTNNGYEPTGLTVEQEGYYERIYLARRARDARRHRERPVKVERESGPRRASGDQGREARLPAARGCVFPIVSWPNAGREQYSSRALEVTEVFTPGSHAANEARVNRELGAGLRHGPRTPSVERRLSLQEMARQITGKGKRT